MNDELLLEDARYVWHPYAGMFTGMPVFAVKSARGVRLELHDGTELIDGMASWWCVIHGYNHPRLNAAIQAQTQNMAHVMFGGLTHEPAVKLAKTLARLTPGSLENVFFADSGSVAVEVAMKMALQYQKARGFPQRQQFLALRGGYHGDTLGAMSVCDPVTGMHRMYERILPRQFFAPRPSTGFNQVASTADIEALQQLLERHQAQIAALILEPIVQGAGGMYFYSAEYLQHARRLCDQYEILLIADEIATGFGRTGRLFACEHAAIVPDILCLGKALTGGYMTLAATLTQPAIAQAISQDEPGVLMHGPTFMANPLACAVADASVALLLDSPWQERVMHIEQQLREQLQHCQALRCVREVRVLGAIGVVELHEAVDMRHIQPAFVEQGAWIRPFGRLVYVMPPFIIEEDELHVLTRAIFQVLHRWSKCK